jgi:hypothetical protein
MEWLRTLGPDETMAVAWVLCRRADWMLWALLENVDHDEQALHRAMETIVERAIRRGVASTVGMRGDGTRAWQAWAWRWLSGEVRSAASAWGADAVVDVAIAGGAARCAAEAAEHDYEVASDIAVWCAWASTGTRDVEQAQQADDIRAAIPHWPGP